MYDKRYANQKTIRVAKDKTDDKNPKHYYVKINIESNKHALHNLSPTAYKLYMYINLNQHGYLFALSKKEVLQICNISKDTYHKAVKELIEKDYLSLAENNTNNYTFYEASETNAILDGRMQPIKIKDTEESKQRTKGYVKKDNVAIGSEVSEAEAGFLDSLYEEYGRLPYDF